MSASSPSSAVPDRMRWNHNLRLHPGILAAVPRPCPRALDVGCGEGALTRALRSCAQQVVGIDLDMASLALASARGSAEVGYLRGDLLAPPFRPESFDLVTCVAALHHVDATSGLLQMARLLRPGGVLVVVGLARSRLRGLPRELVDVGANRVLRLRNGWWESPAPTAWPPPETWAGMRRLAAATLPGVRYRRHLLWRYSLVWTKPR